MTMHKALHPKDDVDCTCQEKNEEALKIASMHRYNDYKTTKKKHGGTLITATRNNTDNTSINKTKITRKQKWEEKQLYEDFKRQRTKI